MSQGAYTKCNNLHRNNALQYNNIHAQEKKIMVCKNRSNAEMNTDAEISLQMWVYTLKTYSPNMTKNSEDIL